MKRMNIGKLNNYLDTLPVNQKENIKTSEIAIIQNVIDSCVDKDLESISLIDLITLCFRVKDRNLAGIAKMKHYVGFKRD